MPDAPRLLTRSTAIFLTGGSARFFDERFSKKLATESKYPRGREYIVRESLEAALGRPITHEEYVQAEFRGEPQRRRQAEYRNRKMGEGTGARVPEPPDDPRSKTAA